MIDLTEIGAGGKQMPEKVELIKQFELVLSGEAQASKVLFDMVPESTESAVLQWIVESRP